MALLRLLSALVLLFGGVGSAHAWTETRVEGMHAHVDLQEDGSALVALRVRIRVLGGWLSRFDLNGLGQAVVLDADKPPWVLAEDGEKRAPEVELREDGTLRLRFARRRDAPRRGRHEIGLLYRTRLPLSSGKDGNRAQLTLPAWPIGLQDVSVAVVAPATSTLVEAQDLSERAAVTQETRLHGSLAFHKLQRVHLPRTVAWTIGVDLPPSAALLSRSEGAPPAPWRVARWPDDPTALWVALALALLCLLKLTALRATARRDRARMLVPGLRDSTRGTLLSAASLLGGLCYGLAPSAAWALFSLAVLLALSRPGSRAVHTPALKARRATALDRARARRRRLLRWLGPMSCLDAFSPAGFALCATLWATVALALSLGGSAELWLGGALLASALLINSYPRHGDRADALLLRLSQLQGALERQGVASELWVDSAGPCAPCDAPRLRVSPPASVAGLQRIELRALHSHWLGRSRQALVVLADSTPDSAADIQLARALPHASVQQSEKRRRRVAPTESPMHDLTALSQWLHPHPPALRSAA